MSPRVPPKLGARSEVRRIAERGRRISTPIGRIIVAPAEIRPGRIFFVVSKQVSKNSVIRNRIRRRLREWIRKNIGGRVSRWSMVIFVHPAARDYSRKELYLRAARAFSQLQ